MKQSKSYKGLLGAGVLSAIAASLCCITPVLVMIAGASGAAASFSWIEPARPYLIGITVVVLGFAWHQKLKPQKAENDCNCDVEEKPSFMQSKKFLGVITVFALLMIGFPYYAQSFYPPKKKITAAPTVSSVTSRFDIHGMSCEACGLEVSTAISSLPGILAVGVNYKTGQAFVKYDTTKSSANDVVNAINKTGYKVIHNEAVQNKSQ